MVTVDTKQQPTNSTPSLPTDTLSDPLAQNSIQSAPVQQQPVTKQVPVADFKKKTPKDEAAKNLHDARANGSSTVVSGWIGYILQKIKPPAGPVTGTYVSSFDTARGGFSASRTLPDVPDLVVHGHYQRDLSKPKEAKVNSAQVKWADDEAGSSPPGETKLKKGKEDEILGGDHDKVALQHWEANPLRHEQRAVAVGKKNAKQKEEPLDLSSLFGD